MDRTKIFSALIALAVLCGCSGSRTNQVVVGSKNFTEQVVLGEIVAQHLERRLQLKIDRKLNLGGTLLAHQALLSGGIDLYPEYTGTALTVVLKDTIATDPKTVLARVRSEYLRRFQVAMLDPLGIDNGFAMVVRGEDARAHHLETLSDAAKTPGGWDLGAGYEFQQRPDGLAALRNTYNLTWKSSPHSMDLGLLYKAMEQKQVSMIAANATDGMLSKLDLKVLQDDKHAFPPYEVCVVVREERLRATPGLKEALQELSGKFTNRKMQELNQQVDGQHRAVAEVAAEFLKGAVAP
ncbi:MAG TPA: glycine betaine ABC transporter substrate-binding protein [Bryobacteraceae bacterium]|nr:glycine betaine ABC transporter substrate-binding protein [Bryobacteraceae bacterium]